jgi:hypothetical protein
MAQNKLPATWSDAEVLDGLTIVDKADLIGVPFRITGVAFRMNAREVSIVEIDAERVDGSTFTFADSSTGVRRQIVELLNSKGKEANDVTGEYHSLNVVAPEGVRVSEFMITDQETGKQRAAKTYYLTTSGKRAVATPAATARAKRTTA